MVIRLRVDIPGAGASGLQSPGLDASFKRGWILGSAAVLGAYALLAELVAPRSFPAAVFGNAVQSGLLALFFVLTLRNIRVYAGRARWFWVLMAMGAGIWL